MLGYTPCSSCIIFKKSRESIHIKVSINVVYRYIQISGMMLGAMLEADSRLRAYEFRMRREKKRLADEAVWRRWEGLVEEEMERHKSRGEEERRP